MNQTNTQQIATYGMDWITFAIYLSLVLVGWIMIYAVGYSSNGYPADLGSFLQTNAGKQGIFIGVSLLILIGTMAIDEKFWRTFSFLVYAIGIVLLILVLLIGTKVNGARAWFGMGGFGFQPSELAKFGTSLALSSYLSSFNVRLDTLRSQLMSIALFLLPVILILLQPDMGSALVFLSFFIVLYREGLSSLPYIVGAGLATLSIFALLFEPATIILHLLLIAVAFLSFNVIRNKVIWVILILGLFFGARWFFHQDAYKLYALAAAAAVFTIFAIYQWSAGDRRLVTTILPILLVSSIISFFTNYTMEHVLQKHQQERIKVWLKPEECDPRGSLYNVLQSKMAIGSGGLEGKGFLQGTMTKLNYVPEQSTDFIFCTIGEEQGFIGSFSIIALFLLLLYRLVTLAERQRTNFARHYAYCIAGIIFVHFLINIGMTMGVLPTIGIPLPFISYGGSSLIGFTIMLGVLLKLDSHRFG